MQMTARGEKMKLVTALSRYKKKDSSQQSKRGSVPLRTQAGPASWFVITLWELPPIPQTPASSVMIC